MADVLAEWDYLMRAIEEPYALAIEREKNRYVTEAAFTFLSTQKLEDTQFSYHAQVMRELAEKFQGRAVRVGVMKSLKEIVQVKNWDALWLYLVRLWIENWGAERAKQTAQTTREDLQRVLEQALAPDVEFNPVQVAEKMLAVRALSKPRAETIARTEVHNAMMFASQEGAAKVSRDEGVTLFKRWIPVLDERTRINHASMANVAPIPLDADFMVGGEKMQRPGDPRGSAANTVRCRCVLAYEVQE